MTSITTTRLQSILAVGTLVAAGTASIYILHTRLKRKKYKSESDDDANNAKHHHLGISEENLPTHIQREIYKVKQRKKKAAMISMKSPMYDNIYMLDEHREVLCTISMKKAKWYIKKGIAEWSSMKKNNNSMNDNTNGGEMKCIRLLFQHNRTNQKDSSEELYLCSPKQNKCVACGDDGYHIRHYIVPYSYRTLLPKEYKSHMSHDIVILCPDCHVDCERESKHRMKQMENTLRMQLGPEYNVPVMIEDSYLGNVRSCAIALAKWKNKMPNEKVERYEVVVREYLSSLCVTEEEKNAILNGKNELPKSQLQKACSVNYRVKNPNFVPGSDIVVQSLKGDSKAIEQFIVEWRQHFVDTVHPQHMPTGWRVDNPVAVTRRGGLDVLSDDSRKDRNEGAKSW